MSNPKKRSFNGMSYRDLQHANSESRNQLKKSERKWLKENNYKNVGWNNVINLYYKIKDLTDKNQWEDLTLEELFLEADRIGNKYLTPKEIEDFNQALAQEVNEIAEEIDKVFPDTEIEIIDFGKETIKKPKKK